MAHAAMNIKPFQTLASQSEKTYTVTYRCGHKSSITIASNIDATSVQAWLSTQYCPCCQQEFIHPAASPKAVRTDDPVETMNQIREAKRKLNEAEAFYKETLDALMGPNRVLMR